MNSTVKTIMFWVFILICLMLLWGVVSRGAGMGKEPEYSYSDLLDKIEAGLVQDVTIQGTELHGHLKATPKEQFHTTIPASKDSLTKELHAAHVNFTLKDPQSNLLLPILFSSEILHEELTDPFLLQQTPVIEEAAERASHLTQRLLAFSRRQVLQPTAIDLNRLVSGTLSTLSRTLGDSIAVAFHAGDRLWPAIVDGSQMENAIVNENCL